MSIDEVRIITEKYLFPNYQREKIVFKKGKGVYLWDDNGKEYLDLLAGIATSSLGHSHPKLSKAISKQAHTLIHTSNLYYIKEQSVLAKLLSENGFGGKVFFCNSGAESVESALKLVKRYFWEKGEQKRKRIVAMDNSFHGRTTGALSITGQKKYQEGFFTIPDVLFIPFGDKETAEEAITEETLAVFVEPVQGEGGVIFPPSDYLKHLRKLCDDTGTLLVFDEVQVGIGRLGTLYAYQRFDVVPDVITLAKGLGGGVPIGATIAKSEIANTFVPGTHASTFGGNPLATTAGKIVVEELLNGLLEHVMKMEKVTKSLLNKLSKEHADKISEIRGMGLMWAVELKIDAREVVKKCLEKGVLVNAVQSHTIRITPPLIIKQKELKKGIEIINSVLSTF